MPESLLFALDLCATEREGDKSVIRREKKRQKQQQIIRTHFLWGKLFS
jgi:hypothetical protein